ncbi:MAG: hypothetical protein FDW93_04555 [Bergeyella sp.]|nr:hypothetical protein [Bergeyella sp.]
MLKRGILFFAVLYLSSCSYSFTGSSLSREVKTIQIQPFIDNSPLKNPNLAQQFTIDVQSRFLQRTTLKGTLENPDILIEGEIVDYVPTAPATVSSNSVTSGSGNVIQTSQNKMVISIKVRYENKYEPEKNFERTYTDEATFSSDLDISTVEDRQIKIVTERIINKMFNDIIADW